MDVAFAHVCDHALIDKQGKLSVIGIFRRVWVRDLPATHLRMVLVFELEARGSEIGHAFEIDVTIQDQDGRAVLNPLKQRIESQVKAGKTIPPASTHRIGQVVELHNLNFKTIGPHQVSIFVNGTLKRTLTFEVARRPGAGAG